MSEQLAFDYPPDWGNAVALVVYYAVFLGVQIALGCWYLRRWNWSIFLGLVVFLILVILGSVAYLKMSYAPVTGSWYSLWIFTPSAGPAFFIASVHVCMAQVLRDTRSAAFKHRFLQLSSQTYLVVCLGIDGLALILTIIGAAYVGAKAHISAVASQPGFDIMTAAMAVQICDMVIMLVVGIEATISFEEHRRTNAFIAKSTDVIRTGSEDKMILSQKTMKRPSILLATLLTVGVLLFAQTVVRLVDVAGGFNGPLRVPVLPNVEAILLFVAILVITALHPAIHLQKLEREVVEK